MSLCTWATVVSTVQNVETAPQGYQAWGNTSPYKTGKHNLLSKKYSVYVLVLFTISSCNALSLQIVCNGKNVFSTFDDSILRAHFVSKGTEPVPLPIFLSFLELMESVNREETDNNNVNGPGGYISPQFYAEAGTGMAESDAESVFDVDSFLNDELFSSDDDQNSGDDVGGGGKNISSSFDVAQSDHQQESERLLCPWSPEPMENDPIDSVSMAMAISSEEEEQLHHDPKGTNDFHLTRLS